MFTGIIKDQGTIRRIARRGGDLTLRIESSGLPWREFEEGESIAVNGVCLTAVRLDENGFEADVSGETLAVTTLGQLKEGARVNLEPSLAAGDRLGGHFVSGHVDGIGTITARKNDARSVRLEVSVPKTLSRYIAQKGSITIDGVSLTVNAVSASAFDVNIIPHTAEVTILSDYRPGTRVNIEIDMLARYLERLVEQTATDEDSVGLNIDTLRAHGYA